MASDIKEKKMKDEVRTRHVKSLFDLDSFSKTDFLSFMCLLTPLRSGCPQSNLARAHQERERVAASQRGVSLNAGIK